MSANRALSGLDELRKTLTGLKDRGVKKAVKAGISAGLQEGVTALRSGVNSAPVSGEMKAAARKTIGKSLRLNGENYVGKFGFGVGKQGKRKQMVAKARAYLGKIGSLRGIGISAANIQWPVLGTKERQTASGHRVGSMPASLAGLVQQAAESASSRITAAAAERIAKVLAAEAAKAGSG